MAAKLRLPQISWHGREPVLSVDVSKGGLLATGGSDNEVRLWRVNVGAQSGEAVSFVQDLSGHAKPVNAVRWDPSGGTLASAGDDGMVMLWRDKGGGSWGPVCALRGHCADVYDLSWSPNGEELISGSVDGSCIVWNIAKAKPQQTMRDHEHYVQGVAWDPCDGFVVSVSCDRSARVYKSSPKKAGAPREFSCSNVLSKRTQAPPPVPADAEPKAPPVELEPPAAGAANEKDVAIAA